MTTRYWPASFPKPRVDGYSESNTPPIAAFEPDVGPTITRRRGTVSRREINAVYTVHKTLIEQFERFFDEEIASGTLSFRMEHPRTNNDRLFKIKLTPNQPAYSVSPKSATIFDLRISFFEIGP